MSRLSAFHPDKYIRTALEASVNKHDVISIPGQPNDYSHHLEQIIVIAMSSSSLQTGCWVGHA